MSNVHFTGISKPGDVEDLQTEHPWWATATGRPRPRSARGCLPGPSAEHRHPPKRSRRGALHTNLPAFQVMVVVVMVLDNMRCDISLTVHLSCMYTWQIPTTPSIHFVAWKPPLLPLTSSHQKSLALSPSSCSGYGMLWGIKWRTANYMEFEARWSSLMTWMSLSWWAFSILNPIASNRNTELHHI